MKRRDLQRGKSALELIEEAVHLLRLAPVSLLCIYYMGTLPFVMGLLYFWADMSRGSFSGQRLPVLALGMAILFVWMKTGHAIFARQLLARLCGESSPKLTALGLLRAAVVQTIIQPSGLILLPIALVVLVPFGWVYGFYQNVTLVGNGDDMDVRAVLRRAWNLMLLWPGQNNAALLALKLFGLFVFLNLLMGVLAVPFLLKMVLGIETVFTHSIAAVLNTTFFAVIVGLAHLCMDPLVKTVFVLRCFYGESLRTGQDLKTELRGFAASGARVSSVVLLSLLTFIAMPASGAAVAEADAGARLSPRKSGLAPSPGQAVAPSVNAGELDRAIGDVLKRREYDWRLPRVKEEAAEKGWFANLMESTFEMVRDWYRAVRSWIDRVMRWIFGDRRIQTPSSGTAWVTGLQVTLVILLVALACILAVLLIRAWRRRHSTDQVIQAQAVTAVPDLADENVGADQLPEDGWLSMARELIERGELRLALRAFYLASLAHLAEKNLVGLARFKSNRDYEQELARRGHAIPEVASQFSENVRTFDRVWYGLHEVTREMLDRFATNVERIKLGT